MVDNNAITSTCELAKEVCQKLLGREVNEQNPEEAMADLEEVLQEIRRMHRRGEFSDPESFLRMVSCTLGTYAGELMLQASLAESGFAWADTENYYLPVLKQKSTGSEVNPIHKVWKKLWNAEPETDCEGSIYVFYIFACGLAEMLGNDKTENNITPFQKTE